MMFTALVRGSPAGAHRGRGAGPPAQAAFAPEAEAADEADAESPSVLPFQGKLAVAEGGPAPSKKKAVSI